MIKTVFYREVHLRENDLSALTNEQKTLKNVEQMVDRLLESCTGVTLCNFFQSDVDLFPEQESDPWPKALQKLKLVTDTNELDLNEQKACMSAYDTSNWHYAVMSHTARQMHLTLILKYLYFQNKDSCKDSVPLKYRDIHDIL